MYLNPALAGMDNNFRLFVNNKNQWSKVPAQFNTSSISIDTWQNHQNSALSMLYSTGNEGESYFRTDRFHLVVHIDYLMFFLALLLGNLVFIIKI